MSTYSAPTTSYGPYGQVPPPNAFATHPGSELGLPAFGDGSLADQGRRFVARLLDGLIMLPWALVSQAIATSVVPLRYHLTTDQYGDTFRRATLGSALEVVTVDVLLIVIGWLIYETVWTQSRGRTFGKQAMHIQVWRVGTRPFEHLTSGEAFTRSFVYNFLGVLILPQLGNVLACTFTRNRQCLHDYAAKTVVLNKH